MHAETGISVEIVSDHFAEVMKVDDDILHSKGTQAIERDLEKCASSDFDEGFGAGIGKRAQARAQACSQDHRLHLPRLSSPRWRTTTCKPLRSRSRRAICSAR